MISLSKVSGIARHLGYITWGFEKMFRFLKGATKRGYDIATEKTYYEVIVMVGDTQIQESKRLTGRELMNLAKAMSALEDGSLVVKTHKT